MYIYIYGIIWLYCDQHGNLMLLADNVFDFDLFFFGGIRKATMSWQFIYGSGHCSVTGRYTTCFTQPKLVTSLAPEYPITSHDLYMK